jgi:hypothetical protein
VTPASSVAALLPGVPYAESATLGCAVFTAYGALHNSAGLQRGESLVIVGAGGIGARPALLIPHSTYERADRGTLRGLRRLRGTCMGRHVQARRRFISREGWARRR